MKQCCNMCQFKGFDIENLAPRCNKGVYDFLALIGHNPSDSHQVYDANEDLRTGRVVDVNGKFFRVVQSMDRIEEQDATPIVRVWRPAQTDEAPVRFGCDEDLERMAEELTGMVGDVPMVVDDPRVQRLDAISEHERSRIMLDAVTVLQRDPDVEDDTPGFEEQLSRPTRGNRFGFVYEYLGRGPIEAFLTGRRATLLWELGCEQGVHKYLKLPFTDFLHKPVVASQRKRPVVAQLAKAMWAESQLRAMEAEGVTPAICPDCGAPTWPQLSDISCAWCLDEGQFHTLVQDEFRAKAIAVIERTQQPKVFDAIVTITDAATVLGAALPKLGAYICEVQGIG